MQNILRFVAKWRSESMAQWYSRRVQCATGLVGRPCESLSEMRTVNQQFVYVWLSHYYACFEIRQVTGLPHVVFTSRAFRCHSDSHFSERSECLGCSGAIQAELACVGAASKVWARPICYYPRSQSICHANRYKTRLTTVCGLWGVGELDSLTLEHEKLAITTAKNDNLCQKC